MSQEQITYIIEVLMDKLVHETNRAKRYLISSCIRDLKEEGQIDCSSM